MKQLDYASAILPRSMTVNNNLALTTLVKIFIVLAVICSFKPFGFSEGQAAQIVHDPTTAANVMSGVTQMGNLLSVTNQVNSRMGDLTSCLGSNLSSPLMTMLSIFGRCSDPFGDIKKSFLGFGRIEPSFDFCSILSAQRAYTELLFLPVAAEAITFQKQQEILQTRQQFIQQSTVNTMAMAAQQKEGIKDAQSRITSLSKRAEASLNLREDMKTNNQLLAAIASEILNLRIMLVNQAEIQASLAANQVPLAFNPSLQTKAGRE